MSDDLEIRHGAVVAVDTATLHAAAHDLDRVCERLADAAALARELVRLLETIAERGANGIAAFAAERAGDLARTVGERESDTHMAAAHLRRAAAVYEYAELTARCGAATDPVLRAVYEAQRTVLLAAYPGVDVTAAVGDLGYATRAPWELIAQAWAAGGAVMPGGSFLGAAGAFVWGALVRGHGSGVVPSSARLGGIASPVVVERVSDRVGSPAGSLQQIAKRIPGVAEIRVERYTMPGGGRQFVVYVAGTRTGTAFDMASNVELYSGQRSASYEAVRRALQRSGAQPGDVVHAVGHSQGGMIANRMAMEGEYRVETVITFGSPVQAEVPASTLVVDLRHDDEIVQSLAGGGSARGVGAPDSFVAVRTADSTPLPDLGIPGHLMGHYEDTAALLDASADPRMDTVREVVAGLGDATSVEVTEYTATRPAPGEIGGWSRVRLSRASAGAGG